MVSSKKAGFESQTFSNDEYKGGKVLFDDELENDHSSITPFFRKVRHKDLETYCLTQSYFEFRKKNTNRTDKIAQFNLSIKKWYTLKELQQDLLSLLWTSGIFLEKLGKKIETIFFMDRPKSF